MNIYMLIYNPKEDEIHKNEPIQPINIKVMITRVKYSYTTHVVIFSHA